MLETIIGILILVLVIWYHIRLLSDKTDYDKIREIIREENKKRH